MLEECGGCGTRFAAGLPRCPHCGSEERAEGEMPKITGDGPTYPEGHAPGDGEEHVHAVVTVSAVQLAEEAPVVGEGAPVVDEPAPGTPAMPRTPPRRVQPGGGEGA